MKIIAVLTTLFLPGTFIAVSALSHCEIISFGSTLIISQDTVRDALVRLGRKFDNERSDAILLGILGGDRSAHANYYGHCDMLGIVA